MTNGEKFRSLFGISASELWCMNVYTLTDWLNEDYVARDIFITQRLNELSTVQLEIKSCDDAISRRDAIEAVTDYILFDVYGGMKHIEKCKAEATRILRDVQSCEEKTVDKTDNK